MIYYTVEPLLFQACKYLYRVFYIKHHQNLTCTIKHIQYRDHSYWNSSTPSIFIPSANSTIHSIPTLVKFELRNHKLYSNLSKSSKSTVSSQGKLDHQKCQIHLLKSFLSYFHIIFSSRLNLRQTNKRGHEVKWHQLCLHKSLQSLETHNAHCNHTYHNKSRTKQHFEYRKYIYRYSAS